MHPEICQQFGMQLIRHHKVVADGTVVCDRLAGLAGVTSIVATEAPCRVRVTDIVRVCTPTYIHCRKDIVQVDLQQSVGRRFNLRSLGIPYRRIL